MLERKQTVVAAISILVIVFSLLFVLLPRRGRKPPLRLEPFEAIGEMAAEETARLLGGRGQVVIVTFDPSKVRMPPARMVAAVLKAEMKGFNNAIKKHNNLTVLATESVEVPHLGAFYPDSGLPADRFFELVEKYRAADAIVSFAGLPLLQEQDFNKLRTTMPKIVAVASFGSGPYQKLLEARVVQVVIVPRPPDSTQPSTKPKTLREWFDRYYEVVTAQTAAALPN
jgi:hypothetical protein